MTLPDLNVSKPQRTSVIELLFNALQSRTGDMTSKQLDAFTAGFGDATAEKDCDISAYLHEPDQRAYVDGYIEMVSIQLAIEEFKNRNPDV